MKLQRHCIALSVAVLSSISGAGGIHAETALEQKVRNEPAVHTTSSEKPLVVAHFASLRGYIDGEPNNEARLQLLHETVDRCVADRKGMGESVNPPTEWPKHLNGMREDFYATNRFAITYYQGWIYGALNPDCSHLAQGNFHRSAVLKSSAGACRMDLIAKTAKGQCDMDAHRNAKIRPSMPVTKGSSEQVAGLACQSRIDILGTICVATEGHMTPAYPLVLRRESELGAHMNANQAALDIQLSEHVFSPHIQGGFTVQDTKK